MDDQTIQPLRVFTWHIHGSYLYYLSQAPCIFIIPEKNPGEDGYWGRTPAYPWGDNVISVPAGEVKDLEFDCILFQHKKNYLHDQYEILTEEQRSLPRIYVEHDPPREVPTDTKHVMDEPDGMLVHVTHFNELMYNNNRTPTTVVPHGVIVDPSVQYTGEIDRGIVVINNLHKRGRRLGIDVFERVRKEIPLDLVGIAAEQLGGIGEVNNRELAALTAKYRFFFNPIRYTSLGLAICEAMMIGCPIVGLATTEMPDTITNDYSGYVSTNIDFLIDRMKKLLDDPGKAMQLGRGAKETALEKFNIDRFVYDWMKVFEKMTNRVLYTSAIPGNSNIWTGTE
jgi:glycosyltransferase involved in cell wall biosynthesis